jgi:hypothetical protein
MQNLDPTVVIRAARGSDGDALGRLARLDSQRPLAGDVLLAEQDGELVAALAGERVIADPFRHTADVVALLRLRGGSARQRAARSRQPRPRAHPAPARRVAGASDPGAPAAVILRSRS